MLIMWPKSQNFIIGCLFEFENMFRFTHFLSKQLTCNSVTFRHQLFLIIFKFQKNGKKRYWHFQKELNIPEIVIIYVQYTLRLFLYKNKQIRKKDYIQAKQSCSFFVNIVMVWVWMPCAYVEYTCLIPVYGCLVHMYNIPALYMCYSNVCLYVHVYMILSLFMNKCVPSWLVKIWYISQICNS